MDFKLVHRSAIAGEIEDDDEEDAVGFCVSAEAPAGIVRRGWAIGKRLAIVGATVSSAPVIVPPMLLFSTLGLVLSVPFGLYFAGVVCTEKLMSSLLPLPKEEELFQEWEQDVAEGIAGDEAVSLLPLDRKIVNDGDEDTKWKSDREEELTDGMTPVRESQTAREEGEDAVADGHELQPIVVSEALEGSDEEIKSREDESVLDIMMGAETSEEALCSGDGGQEREGAELNLMGYQIDNKFVDSASGVDALVPDAEGVAETREDYDLTAESPVADGWQEEEVGIDILDESAPVLDTNEIAYAGDQIALREKLYAADTGKEGELGDMGIDASVLEVPPMFDAEAQEEGVGIGMIENLVTGVPDGALVLDAEAVAETDEQIIPTGELQLEDEWPKDEGNELTFEDNAAAAAAELTNDLKSKWLQVPEELMAAEVVMSKNNGGIDDGVANEPECEGTDEDVKTDMVEVPCRSTDVEMYAFVEQLQGTQSDVAEPTSLEVLFPVELEVKTSTSHLNLESETASDQMLPAAINGVDHDADGRNEVVVVVGDAPQTKIAGGDKMVLIVEAEAEPGDIATAPTIKAAQETSAVSAVEDTTPSGVADRELNLKMVHNNGTSMPSDDESQNAAEKVWQQVYALRTIVGYKAPLRPSLAEELKDLYLFTGIEMSSDPSTESSDTTLLQLSAQLQLLKSVIGVV